MKDLSQYLMLTHVFVVFPLLAIGAAILYRRRRDHIAALVAIGASIALLGGFFTGYGMIKSRTPLQDMSFDTYEAVQFHLTVGAISTYCGLALFAVGFLYLAIKQPAFRGTKSGTTNNG